jgi:hypothetical protein
MRCMHGLPPVEASGCELYSREKGIRRNSTDMSHELLLQGPGPAAASVRSRLMHEPENLQLEGAFVLLPLSLECCCCCGTPVTVTRWHTRLVHQHC